MDKYYKFNKIIKNLIYILIIMKINNFKEMEMILYLI